LRGEQKLLGRNDSTRCAAVTWFYVTMLRAGGV